MIVGVVYDSKRLVVSAILFSPKYCHFNSEGNIRSTTTIIYPLSTNSGSELSKPGKIIIPFLRPVIRRAFICKIHIADTFETFHPVFHRDDQTQRIALVEGQGFAI